MNPPSFLKRTTVLLYGVIAYAIFFLTFCYTIGFVGNFLVPKSMDSAATTSPGVAFLVNFGLLALFSLQHSVMARPFFKRWFTQIIPESAERSTYTLLSSLCLIALFWLWQPMGGVIWQVDNAFGRTLLLVGLVSGWLLVLVVSFLINHFDLFGLRQVWLYFRNRPYTAVQFSTPGLYKLVRHPLYVGWLLLFWCTPTMTITHLFFAVLTTGYILVGMACEERDLQDAHPEYADYKNNTPAFVPRIGKNPATTIQPATEAGES